MPRMADLPGRIFRCADDDISSPDDQPGTEPDRLGTLKDALRSAARAGDYPTARGLAKTTSLPTQYVQSTLHRLAARGDVRKLDRDTRNDVGRRLIRWAPKADE